jgi:hypothetical protein
MRVQVRTLQVPRRGGGAFLPGLTPIPTAATNGQNEVYGCPGTMAVPSPRPPAMGDSELGGPFNQPSAVSPNVFYPSIYYAIVNNTLRFPGRIWSDAVLPVPAVAMGRSAAQTQYRTRVGGRTATAAFRPFTQWPTYAGVRQ